ncbi:trans-aconitate 2-methyltransferase [Roseovarius sp. MMSF_3281]|uniref:class I SAM-dependent methyltransferase n=1 Tax=Roseovarius sp. MMSF_3281 TaxID=3046694 RepID=UPI00273E39F5|nr:class I SAM-dependent methyltransferase [Roseovarius sp. MMSF_3281]
MTLADEEAFLTVHADIPRQGPGMPEDVHWALDGLEVGREARILDAGCGPGADLETLAEARPMARIEGIEQIPHLADEARERLRHFTNVQVMTGDMGALSGFYDFIWSAGAIYFLGVTEGLTLWRQSLALGGAIAFSEPVLEPGAPQAAKDFWADYPQITDYAGLQARVEAAGFDVVDHRALSTAAWAAYYMPLAARVARLRAGADAALEPALAEAEREISLWRAAPEHVRYELMLVRPGTGPS